MNFIILGTLLSLLLSGAPVTARAELYWFDPALGGINCNGECETMAAGHQVSEWYGRALACPKQVPIGAVFVIRGSRWGLADGEWRCLDRGGAVVMRDDGVMVLDLLVREPIWRDELEVEIRLP